MLTDYHLHLRPDQHPSSADSHFRPANVERYRQIATQRGIEELGVSEHIYRFKQALSVWRHPFWLQNATDDLHAYCAFVRQQTDLKLGIEVDFIPGRERSIEALIASEQFDYVIGSVHFLADKAVDMEQYTVWDGSSSADQIWQRYFQTLAQAAASGLFDIIAHPDLVKVWGAGSGGRPLPQGDLARFYQLAVPAIVDSSVAIEVSTAGLRKAVGEIYPAPALLQMCVQAGVPVALSSDAHTPQDVGSGYAQALALLECAGVKELCVFTKRQRSLVSIEAEIGLSG